MLFLPATESLEGRALLAFTISGTIYNDLNSSGTNDPGEPGVSGVTVYLDQNQNHALDSQDAQTTTDSQGHYLFNVPQNQTPTNYYVAEVPPTGFVQTDPPPTQSNPNGEQTVRIGTSTTDGTANFGVHKQAGVTVSPTSGLTTSESGKTDSFTVVLNSQPSANVTIPVSSSDTTEGTVSTSSLTFTAANWNVAQTVTVTGVDDSVYDGNVAYTVILGDASSTDPAYNGIDPPDVSVTNLDNESPPTISIDDVTANEGNSGQTAFNFTISLSVASTQTITVKAFTEDGTATQPDDYTAVTTQLLTFTPGQTTKTFTVLVNGDTTPEPNETFSVDLIDATNASIARSQGVGTILNDDDFAPTTTGIPNVSVLEDAANTVINLVNDFNDAEDGPTGLTYSVFGNTNPGLFTSVGINNANTAQHPLTLDYAPNANGSSSITVRATDTSGKSVDSTFTVNVTAVNDAPTLDAISNQTVAQDSGTHNVGLSGISAGGGESQTLTVTASSSNTALVPNPTITYTSPNATGTLGFTPAAGRFGTATITVTVADNGGTANGGQNTTTRTFTVTVVGAPTANGQTVNVAHATAKAITLTGSDPNSPPRSLTYTVATNPAHGTLSGTAPNLTYTPSSTYQGPDSFTFTVSNGIATSSAATVSLNVGAAAPTANSQIIAVAHDMAKAIALTGNDPNSPPLALTFAVATSPTHGALSGFNAGTGAVTYTPDAGYHGADSFTFTASNSGGTSSPATVTLNVASATPTANPQTVSVVHATAKAIALTGIDPNSPPLALTFAVATSPTHGALSGFNAVTGAVTYTPSSTYQGPDSFTFTVSNGIATSSAATVSLNVGAAAPTANSQIIAVAHDMAKAIALTGNDPNSPPLALTFAVATSPTHGALSGFNAGTGAVTYTPDAGYHGADSFTFTVSNGQRTSSAATVSLNVGIGTPTANSQSVSTDQNTSKAITLTATDDDIPALALAYTVTVSPAHGTLSGTAPNLTYTPDAGYVGPDSFRFTASNGTNTSAAATVSITVVAAPATVFTTSVDWGSRDSGALATAADGLRLLPAGRSTDLPWLDIKVISITLSKNAPLKPADVTVTGLIGGDYGPVTISGSGSTYTITLKKPISDPDRVTLTIGNASITTYARRLDILPGDVNDDGVVNSQDAVLERNQVFGGPTVTIPLIFLDTNGDGVVDVADYNLVRMRNGKVLPPS